MLEIVATVDGFLGIDGFTSDDGRELAVARFAHEEALNAWKHHPDHVETQHRGRSEFFDSYTITVTEVTREYHWEKLHQPS